MKKNLFIVLLLSYTFGLQAQQIHFIKSSFISQIKNNKNDTIYVINFWATWCKPCVEELPYFEQLNKKYSTKNVKVLLVSNDFKKQIDSRLKPFIKSKNIKSEVLFMNETNPNEWIDKVESKWSGAIPATLIICGKKNFSFFKEGEITFDELDNTIKPLLKN